MLSIIIECIQLGLTSVKPGDGACSLEEHSGVDSACQTAAAEVLPLS
jgi:hypothetical protein